MLDFECRKYCDVYCVITIRSPPSPTLPKELKDFHAMGSGSIPHIKKQLSKGADACKALEEVLAPLRGLVASQAA